MKDTSPLNIGPYKVGGAHNPLTIIAGPCCFESYELGLEIGSKLKELCAEHGFQYIFKASYDKANRTSASGRRGPGMEQGLQWLKALREELGVPVLTDIHESHQAEVVARYVDVLQIPAFLCRQTDLLVAAARTGLPINVKKAQFLAPEDMKSVVEKLRAAGNHQIMCCERGTTMGYHQLVVDMRSLPIMRELGTPVVFDTTHCVQQPSAQGTSSGGDRRFTLPLARAAVAMGIDALFIETHPNPSEAFSDGPNMVPLSQMGEFLGQIAALDGLVRQKLGYAHLGWTER